MVPGSRAARGAVNAGLGAMPRRASATAKYLLRVVIVICGYGVRACCLDERLRRVTAKGPESQAAFLFNRLCQDTKTELLVKGHILWLRGVKAARQPG